MENKDQDSYEPHKPNKPSRPIKYWHITYQSHDQLVVPPDYEQLFYCFEQGSERGTIHTHCGLLLSKPMSFNALKLFCQQNNPQIPGQIDFKTHVSFARIIGYHYGLGNKASCEPAPKWIKPSEFDKMQFLLNYGNKKGTSTKHIQAKNEVYLSVPAVELVKRNLLSVTQYLKVQANVTAYKRDLHVTEKGPEPPHMDCKPRHIYIKDKPDTGKTRLAQQWSRSYPGHVYKAVIGETFATTYQGEKYFLFEDFLGNEMPINQLLAMCNGDMPIRRKGLPEVTFHPNGVVWINSNISPDEAYRADFMQYPDLKIAFYSRFTVYDVNTARDYLTLCESMSDLIEAFNEGTPRIQRDSHTTHSVEVEDVPTPPYSPPRTPTDSNLKLFSEITYEKFNLKDL